MKVFLARILHKLRVLRTQQLVLGLLLFDLSAIPESKLVSVISFLFVYLLWWGLFFGAAPISLGSFRYIHHAIAERLQCNLRASYLRGARSILENRFRSIGRCLSRQRAGNHVLTFIARHFINKFIPFDPFHLYLGVYVPKTRLHYSHSQFSSIPVHVI